LRTPSKVLYGASEGWRRCRSGCRASKRKQEHRCGARLAIIKEMLLDHSKILAIIAFGDFLVIRPLSSKLKTPSMIDLRGRERGMATVQERLQGVGSLLVELYEGRNNEAKAGLSQELLGLRARPNTWSDAISNGICVPRGIICFFFFFFF
jgi:hypothetical protein